MKPCYQSLKLPLVSCLYVFKSKFGEGKLKILLFARTGQVILGWGCGGICFSPEFNTYKLISLLWELELLKFTNK